MRGRKQGNPNQLVPVIYEVLQAYDSLSPFAISYFLRVFEILSVVKNLEMALTAYIVRYDYNEKEREQYGRKLREETSGGNFGTWKNGLSENFTGFNFCS